MCIKPKICTFCSIHYSNTIENEQKIKYNLNGLANKIVGYVERIVKLSDQFSTYFYLKIDLCSYKNILI